MDTNLSSHVSSSFALHAGIISYHRKTTSLLRTAHFSLLPWNILIISKNYRSHGNAHTLRHRHTHTLFQPQTYTHTHAELFLVEPVACLSSGLLWVLAAFPACLSPLPQSAALPFNKRHLNLNTQAQSSLSFNLPLKANNSTIHSLSLCVCVCVCVNKENPPKSKNIILTRQILPVLFENMCPFHLSRAS